MMPGWSRFCLIALLLGVLACGDDPDSGGEPAPNASPNQNQNGVNGTNQIANQSNQGSENEGTQNDSNQNQQNQANQSNQNQVNEQLDCLTARCQATAPVGLFVTQDQMDRARHRMDEQLEPYATSYSIQSGRAASALDHDANPFSMEDIQDIAFGWCGNGGEGTLSQAVELLEEESDIVRTLALEYALTGDEIYADKAVSIVVDWAEAFTPVNIYDFNPDFGSAEIDGQTEGFCSDRPWNFALDTMWQTYGLINFSDAYLLLDFHGHQLSEGERDAFLALVRDLIEAVNSSFHAWTKWADHHPNAGSYERYRSDNHLTWSLAGLLAGAAATDDDGLADYVLHGDQWEDSRGEAYENPSHIRDVLDRAIEGDDQGQLGRIYEERIERDPPVGYSFFHLWAMAITAQIAQVHYADDLWSYSGSNGAGLKDAYDRYAEFVTGDRESPNPEQDGDMSSHAWHFEVANHQWSQTHFQEIVDATDRHRFIVQSWGPLSLLFGR